MFMHITATHAPHPHATVTEAVTCEDEIAYDAMEAAWIRAEEQAWSNRYETNEEHRYWTDREAAMEHALVG